MSKGVGTGHYSTPSAPIVGGTKQQAGDSPARTRLCAGQDLPCTDGVSSPGGNIQRFSPKYYQAAMDIIKSTILLAIIDAGAKTLTKHGAYQ